MRFVNLFVAATAVSATVLQYRQEEGDINPIEEIDNYAPNDEVGELALEALAALKALEARDLNTRSGPKDKPEDKKPKCDLAKVSIRRDWAALSKKERKAYTDSVLCLQSKKSKLDPNTYPGAKTRFDDFVVVHVNQTRSIHGTGNFLTWHRYFVWAYEQALTKECGYKGAQPYWNWGTFAHDPTKSPVFDGSDYSMSGNGAYVKHNGSLAGTGKIWIPSGTGGGCIKSGPFKNMKVNLGPIQPTQDGIVKSPSTYAYNPRCLKRDLSAYAATHWTTTPQIAALILTPNVKAFQDNINGDFNAGNLGIHSAGHYTIGGDPGADFFGSPGDPAFYLHHAMVDRAYWIHQTLNMPQSLTDLDGYRTIFNNPPSNETTLDDLIGMGREGKEIPIRDAMNTIGGTPFCYIYL